MNLESGLKMIVKCSYFWGLGLMKVIIGKDLPGILFPFSVYALEASA